MPESVFVVTLADVIGLVALAIVLLAIGGHIAWILWLEPLWARLRGKLRGGRSE